MKRPRWLIAATAALCLAVLTGCMRQPTPRAEDTTPKEYTLQGEIKGLDPQNHVAKVDHDKIEGFMEAMTMDYPVKDDEAFAKLKVGQKIEAKVVVQGLDYWLADVKELPTDASVGAGTSSPSSSDSGQK